MSAWLPIETAPHGVVVSVRRVVAGAVVFEGEAVYARPLRRDLPGVNACMPHWLAPSRQHLAGGPTHWRATNH